MQTLKKIREKNPLLIADDDHPERPDITAHEFSEALDEIKLEHGLDKPKSSADKEFAEDMANGILDAFNKED